MEISMPLKASDESKKDDENSANDDLSEDEDNSNRSDKKNNNDIKNASFVRQMINHELLSTLLSMGIGEIRAEKSLFLTQSSKTIEDAISWLEEHEDDDDIDEPIVEIMETNEISSKSLIPKEEALQRAYELQKKIREHKADKEKKENLQKEKNRIASAKLMLNQVEKLEQEQRKRDIEYLKKEKNENAKERERQRELLRQEYKERFGKDMEECKDDSDCKLAKMSSKEKITYCCNKLKKKYITDDKENLKKCFSTLRIYISNAKDKPTESKYHRIKKNNIVYRQRVGCYQEAVNLLETVGFCHTIENENEYLAIQGIPNGYSLGVALKFIDLILNQF